MRRIVLAVAAVALSLCATENVFAQDILRALYSSKPIANWTGVYVGGNLGYGWGTVKESANAFGEPTAAWRPKGLTGGLQTGANIQTGRLLYGAEFDFQLSAQQASSSIPGTFGGAPFTYTDTARSPWYSTARFRIGAVNNAVLIYATGGFAFGEVRTDAIVTGALIGDLRHSLVLPGWVAGGGVEVKATQNWSWKVEYLHYDLGSFNQNYLVTISGGGGSSTTTVTVNTRFTNDIVRFGVNYKLP